MHWDGAISVGNILTFIGIIGGMLLAYTRVISLHATARNDAEFHPLPGVRRQYAGYVAEEQALWSALEIVRNLEGTC